MFDNITAAQIFILAIVIFQVVYLWIMIPKIVRLWKKNNARGAILNKMGALNTELSALVFEDPISEERNLEIRSRIEQINTEFDALSDEFDNIV